MDRSRETERLLRSLGEDLARDDPRLAAMLSGPRPRVVRPAHLLIGVPILAAFLLLPVTTAVGVVAVVLALTSLLVGGLVGSRPDDGPAPGNG